MTLIEKISGQVFLENYNILFTWESHVKIRSWLFLYRIRLQIIYPTLKSNTARLC